jgi:glycosyltransferase involved in cell wall biosynthesis
MISPSLSIVVPFYNEGKLVESTVSAMIRDNAEFIFVDDGSTDGTRERLLEVARRWPNTRVIVHEQNQGASAALLTGLYAATGDSIIVLDADLSYGPEHIDTLSAALQSQYAAIAVASPYHQDGTAYNVPPTRLALSVIANRFLRSITRSHIATYTGMVRAYSRDFLSRIEPRTLTGEINCALILAALSRGERVVEVPARLAWPDIRRAESRLSMRSLARRTGAVLASLRHAPLPKVPFFPTPTIPVSTVASEYTSNTVRTENSERKIQPQIATI